MRKFLSILLASAMTACAFASCGKIDNDESRQGTSVTEENATAGITDEDTSSADENSDNGDIQPDSEETANDLDADIDEVSGETSDDDDDVDPVLGKWHLTAAMETIPVLDIISRDSAAVELSQDISYRIYFDEDKTFVFENARFTPDDYDFDGENFVIHTMSDNDLTMKKIDGSTDIYGKYQWVSGAFYDFVSQNSAGGDAPVFMESNPGISILTLEMDVENFSVTDDTITIEGGVFGDQTLLRSVKSASYTIDGDKMTVTCQDGEEMIFLRIIEKSETEPTDDRS